MVGREFEGSGCVTSITTNRERCRSGSAQLFTPLDVDSLPQREDHLRGASPIGIRDDSRLKLTFHTNHHTALDTRGDPSFIIDLAGEELPGQGTTPWL